MGHSMYFINKINFYNDKFGLHQNNSYLGMKINRYQWNSSKKAYQMGSMQFIFKKIQNSIVNKNHYNYFHINYIHYNIVCTKISLYNTLIHNYPHNYYLTILQGLDSNSFELNCSCLCNLNNLTKKESYKCYILQSNFHKFHLYC